MPPIRPRRSPFRPLILGVAAIAVVGVAAVVVASAALDPQRLSAELQDAVHRSTGRDLTISGGVHLRLGLSPRFEVDDVALSNLPGGSRPQMLTAKSLSAQVALLPLLAGDAVVSSLALQDPDILLERTADGTPNWRFTPERRARSGGSSSTSGGSHRVEIRRVRVDGGQLAWHGGGPALSVGITSLVWTADSIDSPMSLTFDGTKGSTPVHLTASSGSLQRLQGGPVSALAGAWPLTVDLSVLDATLHVLGGINHPEQGRSYQFRVTANAQSLDELNPLFSRPVLPPLRDVNLTAVLADGDQGELRTSQVSGHAGASDLGAWAPGLAVKQAQLSAPGPGQLAQLNVDGTYQNQPMRLAAATTQPDLVGGGAPLPITLSGQAAGASLSAHGTMPTGLGAPGLDLRVEMRAPDLSSLSPLVGRKLPDAHDVSLAAQVADAGVRLRGIAVHELVVGSSLGDLSGDVTVQWQPRAAITGTLTSRTLNLDAISAPEGGLLPAIWPPATDSDAGQVQAMPAPATDAPAAAPQGASPGPATMPAPDALPLAALRNTDADVSLQIGNLTFGGQQLQDLQAHLQLSDGKLALNPFRATSPEGAIIGGASLDASSDEPPVAVTLRSPAISAGAVAGLLGYPDGAHGTMQVDAQLNGTGQTVAALKASLDGHLGLAMVNGEVSDNMLQGLIGPALDAAQVPGIGGGTSQVRCLAARFNFNNGVATIRTLAADTSKLSLDGTGTINLQTQAVDMHLRPRLHLGPTEVAAPVSLTGQLGALKATLDPVLGGGRVGISIGGVPAGPSVCAGQLAVARGGLGGPMPAAAPAVPGFNIRKPRDLLKGLFH